MEQSAISWTDATFNPWWGCWPVSPGCALCYAARDAERYGWKDGGGSGPDLWQEKGPRRIFGEAHWGGKNSPVAWARTLPEKLGRRPRVFCASMADIGEDHPTAEEERPKLWTLIEATPELDWLLLTKRVETALQWLPARWLEPGGWPPNAWFGFSAENQKTWDARYPFALRVPAAVRFISYEPALGPIDFGLTDCHHPHMDGDGAGGWICQMCGDRLRDGITTRRGFNWLIAGGESGGKVARVSHPDWFRSARDQAVAAEVAFHFKQLGEWAPTMASPVRGSNVGGRIFLRRDGSYGNQGEWWDGEAEALDRVGKRAAGRALDGRTWDEFPASAAD